MGKMNPAEEWRMWYGDALLSSIAIGVGIVGHQNNANHSEHGNGNGCIFEIMK